MNHKKLILAAIPAILAVLLCIGLWHCKPVESVEATFRTEGNHFLQSRDGKWVPFSMIGINIGTGYPGFFPNESQIDERTYERWFNLIGDMNVNTIRVYQIQPPAFYSALLNYNETHKSPIYLLHSVQFPENFLYCEENLLESQMYGVLQRNTHRIIRALHGDLIAYDSGSDRLNLYLDDVSDYVAGYLLGIEWDPFYVEYLCRLNAQLAGYSGDYLYSAPEATPFEIFLAMWGDDALHYEQDRYGTQPMISFANWPDTDPIFNEINTNLGGRWQPETEVTVDVEHIRATPQLRSGIFASYNVYPYFPQFLQYGDYTACLDEAGAPNPYRAYLTELEAWHSCPVVISEFGVPSSRSRTYADLWRGFSHGGLTEQEQGLACAAMLEDIRSAGCAGAIAFSWQDEWYKTVWNDRLISDPDRRAFWSNAQCVEQSFGLMAFEPGAEGETCYPDGNLGDWEKARTVWQQNGLSLQMQQDAKYLYFLVRGVDLQSEPHRINLALDLIPEAGHNHIGSVTLEREADFLLQIDSGGDSALYVAEESDLLSSSALGLVRNLSPANMQQVERAIARNQIFLPGDRTFRLVQRGENNVFASLSGASLVNPVGRLREGNTNPESDNYDCSADYCFCTDGVEIRIPWQLLNFRDPSGGTVIHHVEESGARIEEIKIKQLHAAVYFDHANGPVPFGCFHLESWDMPVFHERLKESYYILQNAFGAVKQP